MANALVLATLLTWAMLPALAGAVVVNLTSGSQLPGFLFDATVDVVQLAVPGITLADEDWAATPLTLTRSVTVMPAPGIYMPTMDMGFVARKVRLGPGVRLTFEQIVIQSWRTTTIVVAPGLELFDTGVLAASDPVPQLVLLNGIMIARICYDKDLMANLSRAFPRAASVPGPQLYDIFMSQAGCVSSSTAAAYQRCWPDRYLFTDLSMDSWNMDNRSGKVEPANYVIRLINNSLACQLVLTRECTETYGAVGCYLKLLQESTAAAYNRGGGGVRLEVLLPSLLGGIAAVLLLASLMVLAWAKRRRQTALSKDGAPASDGVSARYIAAAAHGGAPDPEAQQADRQEEGAGNHHEGRSDSSAGLGPPNHDPGHGWPASTVGTKQGDDCAGGSNAGGVVPIVTMALESMLTTGSNVAASSSGRVASGACSRSRSRSLVPVTPFTPTLEGIRLDLQPGVDFELDVTRVRGTGSYGQVTEGSYQGRPAAVKLWRLTGRRNSTHSRTLEVFRQEVEVLSRCHHPNVVLLLGACLTPPHVCLVMELMDRSLEQVLVQQTREGWHMPLQQVLSVARDVACGLAYLHPTIVHRDLKPANVLLAVDGTAKLGDFGLARLRATAVATAHPEAGTAPYIAPECYKVDNYTITHKADIYSFGVLLWEMLVGEEPWAGMQRLAIAWAVCVDGKRLPLDGLDEARCPPRLRALIAACWDADPKRRPSAEDAVKQLTLLLQQLERADGGGGGASNSTDGPRRRGSGWGPSGQPAS